MKRRFSSLLASARYLASLRRCASPGEGGCGLGEGQVSQADVEERTERFGDLFSVAEEPGHLRGRERQKLGDIVAAAADFQRFRPEAPAIAARAADAHVGQNCSSARTPSPGRGQAPAEELKEKAERLRPRARAWEEAAKASRRGSRIFMWWPGSCGSCG
jgi:hypothetical protein